MATRFGFVSTYPPTQCGLATFSVALRQALVGDSIGNGPVVRLVDVPQARPAPEVVAQLVADDRSSLRAAADQLNVCDIAIVQHEYGVYGGRDGDEVVALLAQLRVPAIVVLHTVLAEPTAHQLEVLESVVAAAQAVVTMTRTARDRLMRGYHVDASKIQVIPHGAPELGPGAAPKSRTGQFTILTWGLLGPGKGIEWGIAAMALLRDLHPAPHYLVAGQTHPKVLARAGEAYRDRLSAQVRRLDLQDMVSFDGHYSSAQTLAGIVRSADAVLLPYDSTEQVTSGVLIEAVAAGKPVVATRFPHACELLGDGAGLLVAHRDPIAIAAALRSLIVSDELTASMAATAASTAPNLRWPAVAARYRDLTARLVSERAAA